MTFLQRLHRALSPGFRAGRPMPHIEVPSPEIAAYAALRGKRTLYLKGRRCGRHEALLRHIERECEKDGVAFKRLTPTREDSP